MPENHKKRETIIHVIDSLGIGGAEKLLENSLALLTEYRHVVCYLKPPADLSKSLNAEKIYFLDFKSNTDILKCGFKLRKIIDQENALFVHAHLLKSTWISRIGTWNKVPLIFTIHNYLSEDAFKINRLSLHLERLTYKKGQILVAVSQAALNDYKNWIGLKDRAYVLYNVIAKEFFNSEPSKSKVEKQPIKLVAVGNLRRQKNYISLVKAFHFLKQENVSLDIYGEGELRRELKKIIEDNGLRVQLMGQANNIPFLLKGYDGFILASSFEGYGIAPVEAMASGLPVLLSDIEVFREITQNNALFFEPLNPESIANAIKKFILADGGTRKKISYLGKEIALQLASQESFIVKLREIYNSINK